MALPSEILVVDDNPGVCTFIQHVLEARGYRVWTANSGGEALHVLVDHGSNLSLLVTDVLMPGMRGPALAQAVRESLPGLPVLFVSGYQGEWSVPKDACLQKPFTPSQLVERVQALLACSAGARAVRSNGVPRPSTIKGTSVCHSSR